MISEKSVQEILEAAKIEEVVQDFVNLKRRGSNLIGLCPFHHEKTPSFSVSPSRNIFKCFGCGRGGNAVQFLMEHEQLTFPEALRRLAGKFGVEIEETGNTEEAIEERQYVESLYLINQYARDFFQHQLFDTDRGRSVGLNYFKERGFREDIIRKFGLGYAPDAGDVFTRQAVDQGYNIDLLRKLGLTSTYDRDFFRGRVMFTIHNLSGKVVGFAGRILNKDVKAPKYINTPETDVYTKSNVLYGAYFAKRAIRQQDECILVEGYTDVLSLHQAGIENVVASSGTSLTEGQIRLIKRQTANVKFLFDGDFAGIKAALRGLDMVLAEDLNVSVVVLPEGEDPDSYLQAVGSTPFQEYIKQEAKDFILFKAGLLLRDAEGDPVKKAHAIKDIVSSIARIPDPLKRSLFIKECAALVDIDEQLLVNETNKLVAQQLHKHRKPAGAKPKPADQDPASVLPAPAAEDIAGAGFELSDRNVGDSFQEKHIVGLIIRYGDKLFDKAEGLLTADFIIDNISDILEYFDNLFYKSIIEEYKQRLVNKLPTHPAYFIEHNDPKIRDFAVGLMMSPHEYSENWSKKHGIELHAQKMPDENYINDAVKSLKGLKRRKIKKLSQEIIQKLKDSNLSDKESKDLQMAFKHLKSMDVKLAKELGIVVG